MSELDEKLEKAKKRTKRRKKIFRSIEIGIMAFIVCYVFYITFINRAIGCYRIDETGNITNSTENSTIVIVDTRLKCMEFCNLLGADYMIYENFLEKKKCLCQNGTFLNFSF